MSRVDNVKETLEKISELELITDESVIGIHLALLGHIAMCLAVIVDKMTEEVME